MCALLIVDDRGVLSQARVALRDAGYLVIPVDDVELGLEMLTRVAYDVVVADVHTLKKGDGSGAVSKTLSALLHRTREAPVVLGYHGDGLQTDLINLADPRALVERVIEASGTRRAISRKLDDDLIYSTVQPVSS